MSEVAYYASLAAHLAEEGPSPCPVCGGTGEIQHRVGLDQYLDESCAHCGGTGVDDGRAPALFPVDRSAVDSEFPPEEGLPF